MNRVLTYGTFDLLHYGHIRFLKRAKAYGDYLIVGLTTDLYNKKNQVFHDYDMRKSMLESLKYVDLVIPYDTPNQYINDIKEYKVNTIIMGEKYSKDNIYNDLKKYCSVKYLDNTKYVSTKKIIKYLNNCKQ